MSISPAARIHPTAVISPEAELADDVQVGPHVVIEGAVKLGPGCVLRPHAMLVGPLTMGSNNAVYSFAVLGERPQHLKYNDEPTRLEIGNDNVFREHVTVHRGTVHSWATVIGDHNYFMANCHVAHDCHIGNSCVMANGALLAGHVTLEDNVLLSGNCAVHQFARCGKLAMLSGCSISAKDMPPFALQQGINCIVGVNIVGMQRAGISHAEINAVRRAYHVLFYQDKLLPIALAEVEKELGQVAAVAHLIQFIRTSQRGICTMRKHNHREAA